jgi:hypothetical protein
MKSDLVRFIADFANDHEYDELIYSPSKISFM